MQVATISRQAGRRYPQLRNLPAIPVGAMPSSGAAPEPSLVNSLRGMVGLRPLFTGVVGLRSLLAGTTGLR